jgi:hypothetical protein
VQQRPSAEHTLFVQTLAGSATFGPKEGREVLFGRNRPLVHLTLGEDDPQVSREHGRLRFTGGRWWLSNSGRTGIRFPAGTELRPGGEPVPVPPGYTLVTVLGSPGREHALEVRVSGPDRVRPLPRHDDSTRVPRPWPLDGDERLAALALARRYLQNDPRPAPQSWRQVSDEMQQADPGGGWTHRRAEHTVRAIRERLSAAGVAGLLASEIEPPVGNRLNENLVAELIRTNTVTEPDLDELDRESG